MHDPGYPRPTRLVAMATLLAAVLAFAGCSGGNKPAAGPGVAGTQAQPAAVPVKPAVLLGQFADQVRQIPEFQARFGAKSGEEAAAMGLALAARGTPRLAADRLVRRAELMHRYFIYEKDSLVCAAIGRNENVVMRKGNETMAINALLEVLGESAPDYIGLLTQAAAAELKGQPVPPPPTQAEINIALERLFARVPKGDQDRLRNTLSNLGTATPADACWAIRGYYQALTGLQEPSRSVMARAIARPPAGQ